jgi:hypothetical protein
MGACDGHDRPRGVPRWCRGLIRLRQTSLVPQFFDDAEEIDKLLVAHERTALLDRIALARSGDNSYMAMSLAADLGLNMEGRPIFG